MSEGKPTLREREPAVIARALEGGIDELARETRELRAALDEALDVIERLGAALKGLNWNAECDECQPCADRVKIAFAAVPDARSFLDRYGRLSARRDKP